MKNTEFHIMIIGMKYIIFVLFFISGVCGLIYEVVWSREFVLVTGGTTHAVTAVVSSFMGGLALGSLLGGRLIDRRHARPVLIYGLLEGGIGVSAFLVPYLVSAAGPLLSFAYINLSGNLWLFEFIRFLVCVAIIFPPTLMMGATLPILVKATLADRERFGMTAGRLYAVNTFGAMAGAGLAGFVLLPSFGNRISILTAVIANLLIFIVVVLLRDRFPLTEPESSDSRESSFWTGALLIILVGYAISGLAALVYQITWTRSLALSLGGSTFSFSLILIAYIGGLAGGGAIITPWVDRIKRPILWAAMIEFGIGLSAIAVLPLLDNLNLVMFGWFYKYQGSGYAFSLLKFGITFGLIAVPTLLMGALLPLVARVVSVERSGAGEPMGWVYSSNTIGAVLGSFLAGYVLISLLGVRRVILFATIASLMVGVSWIVISEIRRRYALAAAAGTILAYGAFIALLPDPDPLIINTGPYIYANKIMDQLQNGQDLKEVLRKNFEVLYFREDSEVTVSVIKTKGKDSIIGLRINGKTDASTGTDMKTQILTGHLPLLIHPDPKKALLIGLASGVSAGSILAHSVTRLDCVELSPAVSEASRYFKRENKLNYSDHRFRLIINDGRNHLALGRETYDLIISVPSNPWQAGQGILFTREFFELMRDSLNHNGIALAWMGIYDMDAEIVSLILRTFVDTFPYVTLWETLPMTDYVMLGSNQPLTINYAQFRKRCQWFMIQNDFARIKMNTNTVLASFLMDQDIIRRIVGPGPLHTDDRRQLEFEMPRFVLTYTPEQKRGVVEKILRHHVDASKIVRFPADESGRAAAQLLMELNENRSLYYRKLMEKEKADRTSKSSP